jgi:hypothetical protein
VPQWRYGGTDVKRETQFALRDFASRPSALLWLTPVLVALAVYLLSERLLGDAIGVALAVLVFVFFVNRPGVALIALVIFLPIETLLFSLLYAWGVPEGILRPASGIKELLAVAIFVAGLRQIRDTERRMDRIDIALLAYVGVVTLYLLAPRLFSSIAPNQWEVRLIGWRSDAGYALLFFGARHAPIGPKVKALFMTVVLAMGAFIAVIALYQLIDPVSYSRFVLTTARVPTYFLSVLGLPYAVTVQNLEYITTLHPLHVSSVFLSPFDMSDYFVLVVAVAAVRISRGSRSIFLYVVLGASLAAIFFSRTRADALAAVIVLVLIVLPNARSPRESRLRLIGALLLAAALIVPSLGGTRFVGAQGASTSTAKHLSDFESSFNIIETYPLGLGLGSVPSSVNRFVVQGFAHNTEDVSQDLVIQVAYELGLPALIPWLAMVGLVLLALKRRAGRGDVFATAMGFALLGIVIAGLFHHVFLQFPLPWTLWMGAGLALSVTATGDDGSEAGKANSAAAAVGVP